MSEKARVENENASEIFNVAATHINKSVSRLTEIQSQISRLANMSENDVVWVKS